MTPARLVLLPALLVLAACGDNLEGTSIEITAPQRGAIVDGSEVTVAGIARGRSVRRVEVNGTSTRVDDEGRFEVTVSVEPGTNILESVAFGPFGQNAVDRRAVSSGELVSGAVADGIFLHYGVRGLSKVAGSLKPNLDIEAVYDIITAAPIKDAGTGCTRDIVTITTLGAPIDQYFMYSIATGLGGEILYFPIALAASADYQDSGCSPQTGTFDFETVELHWTYRLDVTLNGDTVDVDLVDTVTLYDHPLIYTNGDIEAAVFDRVATDIHIPLGVAMIDETTPQIVATTKSWFEAFNTTRSIDVDGVMVSQTNRLTAVEAGGSSGLQMMVSTELEASAGTFVATPEVPEVPRGSDGAIAISDDAINQALGASWRAGGFDITLPSGVAMELKGPPSIRAVSGSEPRIVIGDWMAGDGDLEVALAGDVLIAADKGEIELRLRAESAVLVEQVTSSSRALDAAASIRSEAEVALLDVISAALAAVSVPVAAEAADEVAATSQDGYIEISVDLSE